MKRGGDCRENPPTFAYLVQPTGAGLGGWRGASPDFPERQAAVDGQNLGVACSGIGLDDTQLASEQFVVVGHVAGKADQAPIWVDRRLLVWADVRDQ